MLYESDAMEEGCCEKAGGLPRVLLETLNNGNSLSFCGGMETLEVGRTNPRGS
jgi:hypothetical protein